MSIKISYKSASNEKSIKNYVLFSDEEFNINGLNKLNISKNSNQISKTIISNKSKKKEFISFNLNPDQRIILIKIKNKLTATENEKKGANFYNFLKSNLIFDVTFTKNNIAAIGLYEKAGFNKIRTRKNYYMLNGFSMDGYEYCWNMNI